MIAEDWLLYLVDPKGRKKLEKILREFRNLQDKFINRHMKHICGPKRFECGPYDFVVACVVKDGEPYVKSFIEHYLRLGARQIVFLDNGSTDRTLEIAKLYPNVTIFQCRLPFRSFKIILKRSLMAKIGQKKWAILADIDEFFDYPGSERISMGEFLKYLSKGGYTAVVTQMLDLFPKTKIVRANSGYDFVSECRYYDLRHVEKRDFSSAQYTGFGLEIANKDVKCMGGGIRKAVFGSNTILSKMGLIFQDGHCFMYNDHFPAMAKVADVSAVFYHYKYIGDFETRVKAAVKSGQYAQNSLFYRDFLGGIQANPNLKLKSRHSKELRSVQDLLNDGFLVASRRYKKLIARRQARKINGGESK